MVANARGRLGCSVVWVTVLATGTAAHAARPARPDRAAEAADAVPEALRPWVGWVLHGAGDEQLACPQLHGHDDDRVCAWPARLSVAVNDKGGTFAQEWQVFHAGLAELPGSDEHWPLDVRVDGKPAAVIAADDDDPALELTAGHHLVTGRFAWDDTLPDGLAVAPGDRPARAHRQREACRFSRARRKGAGLSRPQGGGHRGRQHRHLRAPQAGRRRPAAPHHAPAARGVRQEPRGGAGARAAGGLRGARGRWQPAAALRSGWSRPRSGQAGQLDHPADRASSRRRRQRDAAAA